MGPKVLLHEDFIEMIDHQMWACALRATMGLVLALAFSVGAYYAGSAILGTYLAHRSVAGKQNTLRVPADLLQDPYNDDNELPKKADDEAQKEPEGVAFRRALERRRNDPRLKGYQSQVEAACKNRVAKEGAKVCEVDKGVGGGDAATFDPAYDEYRRRNAAEPKWASVDELLEFEKPTAEEDEQTRLKEKAECEADRRRP